MRLVTRGDMDGLVCAVLITSHEKIDEIKLIHPQDITDNKVEIRPGDILANVPFHPNAGLWFDHHAHTATPHRPPPNFRGVYREAPSAARLVYEYYGGAAKMPEFEHLVHETDRIDSADLQPSDVTHPQGYVLLGYTIDGRSSLGAFQAYFHLCMNLIKTTPIDEILKHPKVTERVERLRKENGEFRDVLLDHSRLDGNVVITDLRHLPRPPAGNRFLIYTIFKNANVSVRLQWGPEKKFVICTIGHSIFNRTCRTNVGELAARYGGGGHKGAGSIPIPREHADATIAAIVAELKANG